MTQEIARRSTSPPAADLLAGIAGMPMPPVPEGWEAKAELIALCLAGERRCAVWPAILVERARSDFAAPEDWLAACCERFGWTPNHVHHMRSVGALIGRAPSVTRNTLLDCSVGVLLAMTPLPTNLLAPFCEQVDVRNLTRDQVRDHVATWLKTGRKKGGKKGEKPAQLDFFDYLFRSVDTPAEQFHQAARLRVAGLDRERVPALIRRSSILLDALVDQAPKAELQAVATLLGQELAKIEQMMRAK